MSAQPSLDPLSFRGRRWRLPAQEGRVERVRALVAAGATPLVAPILAARNMAPENVQRFLAPSIAEALPNPYFFRDMDAAVDVIAAAVKAGRAIAIWGDYDVDGATSSAILARFLRGLGVEVRIYIPDRVLEGYGPNSVGLASLAEEGVDLVIIVDSGTVAFEPLEDAARLGLEVVVVDHHAARPELPRAAAILNPNRADQRAGYGYLCAAGVAFILASALAIRLADHRMSAAADLMSLTDLVALGTVCDVVPLIGLNRAFVSEGLKVMNRRETPGLAELARIAGIAGDFSAYHCGFILGPRINAGGRIGQSDTGARLLSREANPNLAVLGKALDAWNRDRQAIERETVAEALAAIDAAGGPNGLAICGADTWHEGVIGIVASRLKDAYDCPAFCFSYKDGMAKGSGRSMPGFDMGSAIMAARDAGILLKGGGHPMAGGVSLEIDRIFEFAEFTRRAIATSRFGRDGLSTPVDAAVDPARLSAGLADAMSVLEPYGQGNPAPRFLLRDIPVETAELVKDAHVKLAFRAAGILREALAFGVVGTRFGALLLATPGSTIDLLVTLKANEWRGRRDVAVMIEDARLSRPLDPAPLDDAGRPESPGLERPGLSAASRSAAASGMDAEKPA